jgi:hypothetical protein
MVSNATIINKLQTLLKWSLTDMIFFPSIYRPGGTEKNHIKLQPGYFSQPRFEPGTS